MIEQFLPTITALGSFVLVALASKYVGQFFSRYGLPYITGYLLTGMLAGPFLFGLMDSGDTERLRFIDELSLAVIAFIAGSELYIKEIRNRLRPIMLNTLGVIVVAPLLLGIVLYIATHFIPFTADFPQVAKFAMALLGATILLALSPASTIAVIQEVRARGSYTKTVLSMTVVMDVVIIILFAISGAIASALLMGLEPGEASLTGEAVAQSALDVSFLFALVLDLVIAVGAGVLVGKILEFVLSATVRKMVKIVLVLVIGLGIFVAAHQITELSKGIGLDIHFEPLLTSMIAGFFVTNFTRYRDQFDSILHDVSPMVYVAFFTLTGVALKLDILLTTGVVAAILFFVRMFSIFAGSYVGGTLAGEPAKFKRLAWMGLITQAGIALGLARDVAVEFPTLGNAFATLVISVVVLNEIFGPMLLKTALRRAGEAHEPGTPEIDEIRDVVILGIEQQSLTLARQLKAQNWQVIMADTNREHVERLAVEDVDERHITHIDEQTLNSLMHSGTDALVAMLDDDAANLKACVMAYEEFGVKRLIVRLNDLSQAEAFKSLGALVVNPTTAMVNLLDQYVRAPQSTAMLMHQDPSHNVTQITITNRDVDGILVRDLRLPSDVLILGIARNGHALVPNGYTAIKHKDELTLLGSDQSLEEVTVRLGY